MTDAARIKQVRDVAERLAALLNGCEATDVIVTQNQDEDSGELLDAFTVLSPDGGWETVFAVGWSDAAEKWVIE